MDETKKVDTEKKDVTSTTDETQKKETDNTVTEQDPLKAELDKVHQKQGKTEIEKAGFSLKKNAERFKELGGDPAAILGIEKVEADDEDDDAPVTVGMLKKIQQQTAVKTAVQLTDDIDNETERELTKYHIENTIKSTGNPQEDFRLARLLVNASKNTKIIEEVARKPIAKTHASGGAPAKQETVQSDLTPQEQMYMKPPFNLTRQQILDTRPKS